MKNYWQNAVTFDEYIKETERRHPPRPPSASLLEGVRLLEADELLGEKPWLKFIDQALLPEGEKMISRSSLLMMAIFIALGILFLMCRLLFLYRQLKVSFESHRQVYLDDPQSNF